MFEGNNLKQKSKHQTCLIKKPKTPTEYLPCGALWWVALEAAEGSESLPL